MDIYDLVIDHLILPTTPRNGDVWSYCPAHNDGVADGRRTPPSSRGSRSLRLSRKTGLKCFAGCKFSDILAAFGVLDQWKEMQRTGRQQGELRIRVKQRGKLVEEYWYCKPDGTPVAIKGRFEQQHPDGTRSKTFLWKTPDDEKWSGLPFPMEQLPLYCTEKVVASDSDTVYFVEGEKACNACWNAGLVAVAAGCGASGTPRIGKEALQILNGKHVVLWPDNDDIGKRYMAAVRVMLDDIAATIRIVDVPVQPSGDAFDFFAGGKTPQDLNEIPTEPWLSIHDHDALTYIYPDPAGNVKFHVDNISRSRDDLNVTLKIEVENVKRTYRQRINLMSLSSRQSIIRELKEFFGATHQWQSMLVDMSSAVDEWIRSRITAIDVASIERPPQKTDLIPGIIPEGEASLAFGEGDSGKTYLALYLAFLLSCGGSLLDTGVWLPQLPVLWVDYETRNDGWTVRRRLDRIAEGIGIQLQEKMVFYLPGNGIPLWELGDNIRRIINTEGIGFIVIDSALKACGGTVRDEALVGLYFSALQKLNVTSLTLGHVTKAEIAEESKPEMPFGSVFWYNEPHGYIWYVERENRDVVSSSQVIRLFNKKANEGRKPENLSINIKFSDPDGPVIFSLHTPEQEQVKQQQAQPQKQRREQQYWWQ